MARKQAHVVAILLVIASAVPSLFLSASAPIPQSAIPTDTPGLPYVECCKNNTPQVNLRSGPKEVVYPVIGVLLFGQTAPAIGKSKGGTWYQVRYTAVPGGLAWVSADFVILHLGAEELRVIDAPPTPTAQYSATLDPTFAAQFSSLLPTRLPTFTRAPAYVSPTPVVSASGVGRGFPPAIIIIGLIVLGTMGVLFSAIIGRR